jgi:hypothetical protein
MWTLINVKYVRRSAEQGGHDVCSGLSLEIDRGSHVWDVQ